MPGSTDRNKRPESHSHDVELDPRLRELLSAEFPDIIEKYEEVRALYGIISKLSSLRRAQGITQAQLADRLGRPQSLISAIESGRQSPHVETLVALARELGYNLRIELEPRVAGFVPGGAGPGDTDTPASPSPAKASGAAPRRRTGNGRG
ncbi:MAG: helix-turn-helix domain-containing protein [Tepidiformaceae bacterium]